MSQLTENILFMLSQMIGNVENMLMHMCSVLVDNFRAHQATFNLTFNPV